jgi:hypothetical protein
MIDWLSDEGPNLRLQYVRSLRTSRGPRTLALHLMALLAMESTFAENANVNESDSVLTTVNDQLQELDDNRSDYRETLITAATALTSVLKSHLSCDVRSVYAEMLVGTVATLWNVQRAHWECPDTTADSAWTQHWITRVIPELISLAHTEE